MADVLLVVLQGQAIRIWSCTIVGLAVCDEAGGESLLLLFFNECWALGGGMAFSSPRPWAAAG